MGIISLPTYEAGLTTGDAGGIVIGTGESGPAGVDGIIEYNNAYLNNRSWWDTYVITSIDGLNDPDIRDVREVNPAQHGETPLSSFYGGRTIVLSGHIRSFTLNKMRDLIQGLHQTFADLTTERPLVFHTQSPTTDLMINCKKSQSIAMTETQTDFRFKRDFQVTLRASNPRFLSYVNNTKTMNVPFTNLVTNPSFETNTTGWTTTSGGGLTTGATLTRQADGSAPSGGFVGKVVTPATANTGTEISLGSLTAGSYAVRLRIKRDTGGSAITARLRRSGAPNTNYDVAVSQAPSSTDYTEYTAIVNIAATDTYTLYVRIDASTITTFYIDAIQVVASSSQTSYFDGSKPGAVWTGTAHNSTSLSGFRDQASSESTTIVCLNKGTFPAQPIITFRNAATNITVNNETTGTSLTLTSVDASEVITVDIARHRLYNSTGTNRFDRLTIDSDWLEFAAGNNSISITATALVPTSSVTFDWRHSYI